MQALVVAALLSIPLPTHIEPMDKYHSFVSGQAGEIWVTDGKTKKKIATIEVDSLGSRGLLGMAYNPTTKSLAIAYDVKEKVCRYAKVDILNLETGKRKNIFFACQVSDNHGVGGMLWQDGGQLLVATGDGGGKLSYAGLSQTSKKLGKVLLLDPKTNEFEEIAKGFRYPYKMYATSKGILIGDIGEAKKIKTELATEEINVLKKGANYGWPCFQSDVHWYETPGLCNGFVKNTSPLYSIKYTPGMAIILGPEHKGSIWWANWADGCIYRDQKKTQCLGPIGVSCLGTIGGKLYACALGKGLIDGEIKKTGLPGLYRVNQRIARP